MSKEKGISIKCPGYTKEIMETINCKRRSKTRGVSIDKKKLTQFETLLLIGYAIESKPNIYEELITINFTRETINKLLKMENRKDV